MLGLRIDTGKLEYNLGPRLSLDCRAGQEARGNRIGTLGFRGRSKLMKRYFFDIREGDKVAIDEEGKELPHVEAAQEEAALSCGPGSGQDRLRTILSPDDTGSRQ